MTDTRSDRARQRDCRYLRLRWRQLHLQRIIILYLNHPGFPPLKTLQELQRLPRILKTIFRERCRALRAVEDEEPGFLVGITVAVVRPELVAL